MKKYLIKFYNLILLFGFDPIKLILTLKNIPRYLFEYLQFRKQMSADEAFELRLNYPCLHERNSEGGTLKGHYFHQDLYVAQRIYMNNPSKHVDIGSRVDGFVAHLASFRKIESFDIRPVSSKIPNIEFIQCDIMSEDVNKYNEYTDSLSCLHAIEHFGLGRYGDSLDYEGHKLGLENMKNMIKPGGKFYLSMPIGKQRIDFNAHRVFSLEYIINLLKNGFDIDDFSYIDDAGEMNISSELSQSSINNNFGCNYGCGIFELTKK